MVLTLIIALIRRGLKILNYNYMKIAVLHAYPPEPDGLSIQGNLLYRGFKEL